MELKYRINLLINPRKLLAGEHLFDNKIRPNKEERKMAKIIWMYQSEKTAAQPAKVISLLSKSHF